MLAWWHHHAKHVTDYETLEAMGKNSPLANQPAIYPGNEWFFDAYMALDSCRNVGMGVGPIPWTAAREYGLEHEFPRDDRALLWAVIHKADTAFRAEVAKTDGK